ncbi:hypothetical protein FGG08_003457 [Glutinoglossum americanum]|uniref:Uncharacterized protein n=1 Tax=Glutinoglossum americanum TaxID=1670608 RepID=A0A9P8I764_9PEZI|nr:hypothetical protein FGG08_003457 [Glutinoglossum americanum]
MPYRLKSSALRLQIPSFNVMGLFPGSKFIKAMRDSGTWNAIVKIYFTARTWSRRTIWGDRSRSSRFRDVLTSQDINELAGAESGIDQSTIESISERKDGVGKTPSVGTVSKSIADVPIGLKIASVGRGGNVEFQDTNDFKSLTRSN